MPLRVIACFLSFVLLWCGFNSHEEPRGLMPFPEHSAAFAGTDTSPDRARGNLHDHHLDDLPGHTDPWSELLGPLPAPPRPQDLSPRLARLDRSLWVLIREPYLDGLLRPPQDFRLSA